MFLTKNRLAISILVALGLVGCAHSPESPPPELVELPEQTYSDGNLQRIQAIDKEEMKRRENIAKEKLRMEVVKSTAFSWALQEAIYRRAQEVNEMLERYAVSLSILYDFNQFMIDGSVLLPSVSISQRNYENETSERARTVKKIFKISEEAKIVPMAPTWRDFLYMEVDEPVKPSIGLFPKNSDEKKAWKIGLREGWKEGRAQVDEMFEYALRDMEDALLGRLNFLNLHDQGIVSMPVMETSSMQVVRMDDQRTLYVGDTIHQIVDRTDFISSNEWAPVGRGERPKK